MHEKDRIFLTPASEMTWGDRSRHNHGGVRDLHSPNEEKQFKIYTPGETAPIMTTTVSHAEPTRCDGK